MTPNADPVDNADRGRIEHNAVITILDRQRQMLLEL